MFIFVYGTLKREWWNNDVLRGSKFLGEFLTEPRYDLLMAGIIPVMVDGEHMIRGELYHVEDEDVLADLDALEGHPHGYRRQPVRLRGFEAPVEGYIGNRIARDRRRLTVAPLNDQGYKEYDR